MDRPPHTRRRPRIRAETGGKQPPHIALLALILCAPGCAALESNAVQPQPEGSLVVRFIDAGQDDGCSSSPPGELPARRRRVSHAGPKWSIFSGARALQLWTASLSATPALIIWGDSWACSTLSRSLPSTSPTAPKRPLPLALSCIVVLATRARRWASRAGMQMEWGDTRVDVIAPLTHRLFSETNDNFVGILLTYGSACLLLAGDARRRLRSIWRRAPTPAP